MYELKKAPADFIVTEVADYKLKESGAYSVWLLEKIQMNTIAAVEKLAQFLHMKVGNIGFAGSKDKHAITEQHISMKGIGPDRLERFEHPNMSLEFLGWRDEPISLGDLEGNRFEITIRNISRPPIPITHMINYFGEQRMGTRNWKIGYRVLKDELKEACDLIPDGRIAEYIKEHPRQYVEALRKVPRRTMLLFIHAYQSRIWNRVVAMVIKKMCRDAVSQKWNHGMLVFPRKIDTALDIDVPVVGFGTAFADDFIKQRTLELLEGDGLTQRDFIIQKLPFLSVEGSDRKMVVSISGLSVGKTEDDDMHSGKKKCRVHFFLPKGSYATMAVRQMMLSDTESLT